MTNVVDVLTDRARSGRRPRLPVQRTARPLPASGPPGVPLLLIGYGNTLRSDDGVGPRVIETLAALDLPGVQTLSCDLLTPELSEPVSRAREVVFVDAAVDAPRAVQLRRLEPAESSQLMAHAADPRTLLAMARDLFGRAPKAWLLTIPVEHLAIGESLSPLAKRGCRQAVGTLEALADSLPSQL